MASQISFWRDFILFLMNWSSISKLFFLKDFEHLKELVRKIERNSHYYTEELLSMKTKLSL